MNPMTLGDVKEEKNCRKLSNSRHLEEIEWVEIRKCAAARQLKINRCSECRPSEKVTIFIAVNFIVYLIYFQSNLQCYWNIFQCF
jgi:hypothetical protein